MPCRGLINGLASDQSFFGGEEGENDASPFFILELQIHGWPLQKDDGVGSDDKNDRQ